MNLRAGAFWAGLAALMLVVAVVAGGRGDTGRPLDPDSTGPLGTHALGAFVEELGGSVSSGLPDDGTDVVLVLADRLASSQRVELETWVEAGGTLVVADPGSDYASDLGPPSVTSGPLTSQTCTIDRLQGLVLEADSFLRLPSRGAVDRCFGGETHSYLRIDDRGDGRLVVLGGALAFTNEHLDEGDNAVLAAELLLAEDGSRVSIVFSPTPGGGSGSWRDLVSTAVKWAGWQLIVAFVVFAWWRARRFGRPVAEPQPVELPGSLLVRSTAELKRRSGGHGPASATLRSHLERGLRRRHKLPPDAPLESVIDAATSDGRVDRGELTATLTSADAVNNRQLADLVAGIDRINSGGPDIDGSDTDRAEGDT